MSIGVVLESLAKVVLDHFEDDTCSNCVESFIEEANEVIKELGFKYIMEVDKDDDSICLGIFIEKVDK